jgi:hypothetical protein
VRNTLVDVLHRSRLACSALWGALWPFTRTQPEATEAVAEWPLQFGDPDPTGQDRLDALDTLITREPGALAPDFAPLDAELARLRRSARSRARRGRGNPAA